MQEWVCILSTYLSTTCAQTAVTLQIALINVYFLPDDEISFSSSLWGYLRDCGLQWLQVEAGCVGFLEVWDTLFE